MLGVRNPSVHDWKLGTIRIYGLDHSSWFAVFFLYIYLGRMINIYIFTLKSKIYYLRTEDSIVLLVF